MPPDYIFASSFNVSVDLDIIIYGASPSLEPDLPPHPLLKQKDAVDERREGWDACAEVLEECLERFRERGVWLENWEGVSVTAGDLRRAKVGGAGGV